MKPSECGFAAPPPEDSHDREVMDRFADFLKLAGKPGAMDRDGLREMMWGEDFREWRRFIFGVYDLHGPAF